MQLWAKRTPISTLALCLGRRDRVAVLFGVVARAVAALEVHAQVLYRPRLQPLDDLDLDSIDAIDLAVELEQETGLRLEEQELRQIRRVKDIVDLVCDRLVPA